MIVKDDKMKIEVEIGNKTDYDFLNEFNRLKHRYPDLTWNDIVWKGLLGYIDDMEEEEDDEE